MNRPDQPRLRVLCVDDNEMVGEALRRRIEEETTLEWAGLVREGAAALARILEVRPDIVLMDIDIPGLDTFTIVERLATEAPEVRVIMFSGHIDPKYIERALDSGAWGYLSKNDDVAALMDGIRQVGRGHIVMSKDVQAVQRNQWNVRVRPAGADPRSIRGSVSR